jgi:hypothetical protein
MEIRNGVTVGEYFWYNARREVFERVAAYNSLV